ncbi:hypothetical protein G7054_g3347 [Neopestalotiopsis clavispora]|nr:hypothetical protein G7054_g3347 [Neopestalotiopsis clavispora]
MIPICQVPPERDSTPLGQLVPENVADETIEKRAADSERCETRQSLDDEQSWSRFSPLRKKVITLVVTMSGFNAAMDSMIISSAIPEVASTFNTTGSIINISNGLYMLFMALCPLFWGPLSQVYGRRWIAIITTSLFAASSIGTALSPNLASYIIFRNITGFQATATFLIGSSCIGDIYHPRERATALGWFLFGTVLGPAFGPFLGGVIVTYKSWRVIFWMQASLGALAAVLEIFFLPETSDKVLYHGMSNLGSRAKAGKVWSRLNPVNVFALMRYPNLLAAYMAAAALIWNQQTLLTPVRYVINPRFNLTTPMQSGYFFLAPGVGCLLGAVIGGPWADNTVRKWHTQRGERVPEDRLRSSLLGLGVVIPVAVLVYGWTIEKEAGGIPVPVIAMFLQGLGQMLCFPSINAYCLDVKKDRGAEVISGAYMVRYAVAAIGTAACSPAIDSIGLGWFSVVTAIIVAGSASWVGATIFYGRRWRERIDRARA